MHTTLCRLLILASQQFIAQITGILKQAIFLFSIDFIRKGCNPLNKQYLYSNYSLFLVSKNILSFRAGSAYLSALSCYRQFSWMLLIYFLPSSKSKKKMLSVWQFLQELNKFSEAFWVLRGLSHTLLVFAQQSGAEWNCPVSSSTQRSVR